MKITLFIDCWPFYGVTAARAQEGGLLHGERAGTGTEGDDHSHDRLSTFSVGLFDKLQDHQCAYTGGAQSSANVPASFV